MRTFLLALAALSSALLPRLSSAEEMVALTSDSRLLFFDSATPGTITRTVAITGASGEMIAAIDYRPATGGLYAYTNGINFLYLVNDVTGVATRVGPPLTGIPERPVVRAGFDFNPTVDRIRLVLNGVQNVRLNPDDASTTADSPLAYAAGDRNFGVTPNVVGSAYTNSFAGATSTVLYGIDSGTDTLVIQNPPNAGGLITVGSLGVDTSENVGFDISGLTGRAYASLTVANSTNLYTIDLVTGAATVVGLIGDQAARGSATITDIAVLTPTRLVNLSARGQVGAGANVLIGGFVNRGRATSRVVFRALGPSLTAAGVTGALPDPTITIYDSAGAVVATNDDFATSPDSGAAVTAAGLAPTNAQEAAIQVRLRPGAYTAIVSGKGGASGVALLEIYELP